MDIFYGGGPSVDLFIYLFYLLCVRVLFFVLFFLYFPLCRLAVFPTSEILNVTARKPVLKSNGRIQVH